MPTISMEEVAPVAMSDATLLAPQEIVDKKRGKYSTVWKNEKFTLTKNISSNQLYKIDEI